MVPFSRGDFVPTFVLDSTLMPDFHFSQAAGRRIVLSFFGSTRNAAPWQSFLGLVRHAADFPALNGVLFGVSADPGDRENPEFAAASARATVFWDLDKAVCRSYGVSEPLDGEQGGDLLRAFSVVIDENLRFIAAIPMSSPEEHAARVLDAVQGIAPPVDHAPVLILPDVFEPDFCTRLIAMHDTSNAFSGQMTERNGRTVGRMDRSRKSRTDHHVQEEWALDIIRQRFLTRVRPEIRKAFAHTFTRLERYLVGCYDAADGGRFKAHRDNTTRGTAHRAFAVSVSLNDDYEGGGVQFAEYGPRIYRAPVGGAVVFSGTLMHEVMPVTRGRRCVFLTFVYDEAGRRIREQNNRYLDFDRIEAVA